MTDEVGRSRWLKRAAQAVAWSAVPVYVLGMGSKIWLDYQLGLEITLFDVMLAVGFGAFVPLARCWSPGGRTTWSVGSW